jgi:hypothetical protein
MKPAAAIALFLAAYVLCATPAVAFSATKAEAEATREWIQEQNIPRWVREVFAAKKMNEKYAFAYH